MLYVEQGDKVRTQWTHTFGDAVNGGVILFSNIRLIQLVFFVILQAQMLIGTLGQSSISCFVKG